MFFWTHWSPLKVSIWIHFLVLGMLATSFFKWPVKNQILPLEVYIDPLMAMSVKAIKEIENDKPVKPQPTQRQVFGANRKSITNQDSDIGVKTGNTLVKENDELKLKADDAESLPIPVADYLITDEPEVLFEPKNKQRTEEARKNGYTGTAMLKILIDAEGQVRDVKLMNSLKFGLNEKAIELAKQVKLKPARVNGKSVSVWRDFTITFKATD